MLVRRKILLAAAGLDRRADLIEPRLLRGFYGLALTYENLFYSGRLRFFWVPRTRPLEIVPAEYLYIR